MNERKILFVRTHPGSFGEFSGVPAALLYLSSYLKQFGYNVIVRDLFKQIIEDKLWSEIKDEKIAIVGITMLSRYRNDAYNLARKIKSINQNVKVVLGGIHASSIPKLLVDNLPIDAVVIGEGELTMKELADLWINNIGDISKIKGIYTKEYGMHEARELIKDLDTLPLPDYEQTNFDWFRCKIATDRPDYIVNGQKIGGLRYANIYTSRGCMGRCVFCNAWSHWKGATRFRSAKNVLEEMKYLYNKHNIRLFNFNDDCFGQNKKQVMDICEGIIERGMKIAWYIVTRVDCMDKEMLQKMKEAGCFVVSYGVESGSEIILKNLNKGITKQQIKDAITITKEVGIKAYALLMTGNLGESYKTIQETIDFMNEIKPDIYSFTGGVLVFPGTVYSVLMKKKGLLNDDFWIKAEDGLPIFLDNFTASDLGNFNRMILSIPQRW